MKYLINLLLMAVLCIATASKCESENMSFSYTDGSNNSFHISPGNLKYDPMSPEFSNTGSYSGGEPQEVPLSDEVYQNIIDLAKAALKDKDAHLENRPKGSGTLSMDGKRVVLAMSSESKYALESALRDLLN